MMVESEARPPHELGDKPAFDDALTKLIQAAAHFGLIASAQFRQSEPGQWAEIVGEFDRGAEVETRVRIAPAPNVRLFLNLPGGEDRMFFETSVRESGQRGAMLN